MTSDTGGEARICAANCRIHEQNPGPDQVEVGTADERRIISRVDYWRDSYTRTLVAALDAEITQLLLAREESEAELADAIQRQHHRPGSPRYEFLACAVDLCDRGIAVVRKAGADQDEATRKRLIAAMKREDMVETLGGIPGITDRANRVYAERLAEIEDEERS